MARNERAGVRDMSFSAFHRAASLARFVGWERAKSCATVDIDFAPTIWVEYRPRDRRPLCLVETAIDDGTQDFKPATVIAELARRARIPAYLVLYERSLARNPADPRFRDIQGVRMRRLYPRADREWRRLTPQEYAEGLIALREWVSTRLDAANDPTYDAGNARK